MHNQKTLFLFAILAIALFTISSRPVFSEIYNLVVIGSSILLFILAYSLPALSLFLLGFLFSFLPIFNIHSSLLVALCWSGGVFAKTKKLKFYDSKFLLALIIIVLLYFLGGLRSVSLFLDYSVLSDIRDYAGFSFMLSYLTEFKNIFREAFRPFFSWSAAFLFSIALFNCEPRKHSLIFDGLALTLIIASLIVFLQVYGFIIPVANRFDFWVFTERYSGTFSDPNAYGLLIVFLLPSFLILSFNNKEKNLRGIFYLIAALLSFVAVQWSGSRTFWLGILVWLVLFAIYLRKRLSNLTSSKFSLKIILIASLFFISLLLVGRAGKVSSLDRLFETLNMTQMEEMLHSRNLYAKLSLFTWELSPYFGVGTFRFFALQDEVAEAHALELGNWRDNANNFYLQVLAEQGLVGLILVFYALYLMAKSIAGCKDNNSFGLISFGSYLALVIILLTGPHLEFSDVKVIILLLLLASASEVSSFNFRYKKTVIFVAILLIPLYLFVPSNEYLLQGVYKLEEIDGVKFRWLGRSANIELCPKESKKIALRVIATDGSIAPKAEVEIKGLNYDYSITLEFDQFNVWKEIELNTMPPQGSVLSIKSNFLFSPKSLGLNQDPRVMSFQLKDEDWFCR